MKFKGRNVALFVVLLFLPLSVAIAQASLSAVKLFPDSLSVRAQFLSAVITANPAVAMKFKTAYRDISSGRVRISVEKAGSSFYVLFLQERDGAFPYGSRGNVLIKRDSKTGYITQIKWFLSDDGLSWLNLSPRNEKTVVDYIVAGSVVTSGYVVSRLIYGFLTNSFGYLYDATKAGVDWSLIFGAEGPKAARILAASISKLSPSGIGAELLYAASDFSNARAYLAAIGAPDSAPVEETEPRYSRIASLDDERATRVAPAPGWLRDSGLPIETACGLMVGGISSGAAYIALVEGRSAEGELPLKLAIVPYRDGLGAYSIVAVDAGTGFSVDFAALVKARPGARMRLFRLPLPADS